MLCWIHPQRFTAPLVASLPGSVAPRQQSAPQAFQIESMGTLPGQADFSRSSTKDSFILFSIKKHIQDRETKKNQS
uniref:Uncharacterized protein n=1 Tax=Arundo donax TaxID=35708 RepID=A0A0A9CHC7_ARUDO